MVDDLLFKIQEIMYFSRLYLSNMEFILHEVAVCDKYSILITGINWSMVKLRVDIFC